MRWITSAGGPLMLLDERHLEDWGGAVDEIAAAAVNESWSPGGKPTDYDRACRIDGLLGRLTVGNVEALVLGGEPMATTWLGSEALDGGMLVRWMFADSEAEVLDCIQIVPESHYQSEGQFSVDGANLLLFDSAFAGRNVMKHPSEYLTIQLRRSVYEISTAVHRPDGRMYVVVHRLVRR